MGVIIYSARTGRLRRTITDGVRSDDVLLALFPAGPGEVARLGPPVTQQQLNALTGLVPRDDRYAIVNSAGDVTGAILADHVIDGLPGLALVAHATARVGWRQMLDGTFQRPLDDIDNDIAGLQSQVTNFPLAQAALPAGHLRKLTSPQLTARIAGWQAEVTVLNTERVARLGPR